MQLLGTQNLYLRVVYAHIDNYTQVKGGWSGSQRDLAGQLELPLATVNNQLNELLKRGLIVQQANMYRSTREQQCSADEQPREQKRPAVEQKCSSDEQKRSADELPPAPPIYKEIKKEKESNIVREQIATQNSPSSSSLFEEFIDLYKRRTNNINIPANFLEDARQKWESLLNWQKIEILDEMHKPDGFYKGSPLLTITYFTFHGPKNYGLLAPYELNQATKEHELWSTTVYPNERAWICRIEDIIRLGLEKKVQFK